MVTLNISTNFEARIRALDQLREDIRQKALASALNKTVAQGKTAMARGIADEYNITVTAVKEKLYTRNARASQGKYGMFAVLGAETRGGKRSVNLIRFQAKQTKKGLTAKQLKTKGQTLITRKGFIGNDGRTVFRRLGKARLPIAPIQGLDVSQMFNTKRVNAKVVAFMKAKFPEVLQREVAFYIRRFNG